SHHEQRSYQLTNSYPTYDKANSKHGDQAEKFKPTKKNEEEEASSSKATPNGYSNGELKNEEQSKEMPATRCAGVEMLFASCKVGPTNHHRTTTTSDDTWNTNEEEMPPALNFSKDSVQKNGVRLPNNHVKPARFIRQDSNSRRSPDRSHQRQWDSRQRPADKFSNWRSNDARIDQRSSNFNEERNTKNTKVFYGSNYKGNSSSEFSNGLRKQRENQESSGKNRPYEDQQGSSRTYDRYERNDRLERDDRYERNVRPPRSSRGGFVSSRPRGNYRAASNSTYHSDKNDHNYQ
uniref:Uncharacterized protein n=1 Tax=Acrobeloides nanus TaxID=290746 RepID=A0A914D4A0_9BILA